MSKESYEGTRYQEVFDKLVKRSADQPKGYALSADNEMLLYWSHHVGHWLIVVPDKPTQEKLIKEYHHNFAQHPTAEQQHQQMRQVFFWEGMHRMTREYIKRCSCQADIHRHMRPFGLWEAHWQPTEPGLVYHIDYVTGLCPSASFQRWTCLFTCIDRFSRRLWA